MAANTVVISASVEKSIRILKWKVKEGFTVSVGKIILLYDFNTSDALEQKKLKAVKAGKVKRLVVREGDIVQPGSPLLELVECTHPTVMKDMCGECGADLRKVEQFEGKSQGSGASVAMVHSIPELKVSHELAQKLGRADSERLLSDRKLVLLVDLDQTLIHTTNDNVPIHLKNVYHFQLYGSQSPWYHTRLRPGTQNFLTAMAPLFELHICTFGARNYAHKIAKFLDKDKKFFSHRILSRDECFNSTTKTANLRALFPCGDNMVCIIDDREDVWSHAPNLIHVKPYHFFQHTGDINAPPGLGKTDLDDTPGAGMDLSSFSKKKQVTSKKLDSTQTKDSAAKDNTDENIKSDDSENPEKSNEHSREIDQSNAPEAQIKNEGKESGETTDKKVDMNASETVEIQSFEINANVTFNEADKSSKIDDSKASDVKCNGDNPLEAKNANSKKKETSPDDVLVELDDPDDYLLYLEVILKNIHETFYKLYDETKNKKVPDLKSVIPLVKKKILHGTNLVFSGLVPTHIKLEQSRAYLVAKSLGAIVTQDLTENTTHLVALRTGTVKVNACRRRKNICIVTPDWLWACAERWEWVDEKLFPLTPKPSKNRHPPPHCSSPEHSSTSDYGSYNNMEGGDAQSADSTSSTIGNRKRTASGRFMDSINPLLSFSSADIADMDKEVEDEIEDDSDSDVSKQVEVFDDLKDVHEEEKRIKNKLSRLSNESGDSNSSSSSEAETLSADHPHGWGPDKKNPEGISSLKRKRTIEDENESTQEEFPDNGKDEEPEEPRSMLDMFYNGDSTGDSTVNSVGSAEPLDENDDGEWNMMGAALEREFLGLE